MSSIINNSYLCTQLIEINKKYEDTSFVDINFIQLFGLCGKHSKSIDDFDKIKKKITKKFYTLALKFHPDKYINSVEIIVDVKGCAISVEEIISGAFFSFINDIYNMLINMIIEDPATLLNIINDDELNIIKKIDEYSDHVGLKRRFDNNSINKEYLKPSEENLKKFESELQKMSITEIKIDDNQIKNLTDLKKEQRNQLVIEKRFSDIDQTDPIAFNDMFNSVFNMEKNKKLFNDQIQEQNNFNNQNNSNNQNYSIDHIKAFNFDDNYDSTIGLGTVSIGINSNIYDINDAFEPIRIDSQHQLKIMTFEEMMADREKQDSFIFKRKSSK